MGSPAVAPKLPPGFEIESIPEGFEIEKDTKKAPPSGTWAERLGVADDPYKKGVLDFAEGLMSGAASTVFHGGDLIRRATGMERVIENPDAQQAMKAPDSIPGAAGRFVEGAAEFAVPLSGVSKAVKGAGLLKRMAAEGAAGAGVTGVQSGGDPASMAIGGAGGAALPVGAAAFNKIREGIQAIKNPALREAIIDAVKDEIPIVSGARRVMRKVERTKGRLETQAAEAHAARQAAKKAAPEAAPKPEPKAAPARSGDPRPMDNPKARKIAEDLQAALEADAPPAGPPKTEISSKTYAEGARTEKAGKLAKVLHDNGISAADAKLLQAEHWEMAAKAAGVNKPSLESVERALFEMRKLEKAAKAPRKAKP